MVFKIVISDPENGKAYQLEVDTDKARFLIGMKIGQEFDATPLGLAGYRLKITGGTDKDGFPMRKDINGPGVKYVLLASGPGYRPKEKGVRRRKRVRGNTISQDIVQINTVVVKKGKKSLEELIPKKEK